MDEENKTPAKEKPAKQPKAKPAKTKEAAPRRRERPIDAKDVFVPGADSGEASMNDLFRMRLAYLMNGNNSQGKSVNIQELADAVGVSRQTINAIEKGDYNPTIRLCLAICKALGKTLDELFWED